MKRIIIITGIILLAVTASAQRGPREQARQDTRNHKSETTSRQDQQHQKARTPAGRTAQTHNSKATTRREAGDRKPVQTGRHSTVQSTRHSTVQPTRHSTTQTTRHSTVQSTRRSSVQPRTDARTKAESRDNVRQGTTATRHADRNAAEKGTAGRLNGSERHGTSSRERVGNQGTQGRTDRNPDAVVRRQYTTPDRRHVRSTQGVNVHYRPAKYRRIYYRNPGHIHVIWTRQMYREYRLLYPDFRYWYYPVGYTIVTIPAYNAALHIGEVRNVYGRVHDVWYSWDTDEYYLYFGGTYPYQDFTVILQGSDARRINRFPESFFEGRYIWVTGLVSTFEGKPEIMVRRSNQVHLY